MNMRDAKFERTNPLSVLESGRLLDHPVILMKIERLTRYPVIVLIRNRLVANLGTLWRAWAGVLVWKSRLQGPKVGFQAESAGSDSGAVLERHPVAGDAFERGYTRGYA